MTSVMKSLKNILLAVVLVAGSSLSLQATRAIGGSDSPLKLIRVSSSQIEKVAEFLDAKGVDVEGLKRDGLNSESGSVSVVVQNTFDLTQHQALFREPYSVKIELLDEGVPYRNIVSQRVAERARIPNSVPSTLSVTGEEVVANGVTGLNDEEDYMDLDQTLAKLKEFEKQNPGIVKLFDLTELTGEKPTAEGRHIYGIQVSQNPAKIEDEPKVVMVAQHHARELTTQHAVIDSAEKFIQATKTDSSVESQFIQSGAVWFVPVVNPDGLQFVFNGDRYWRKNRSKNADGSRGVDLNRNYEFKYGSCGQNSTVGGSETYRGERFFSEPETRTMDKFVAKLHPQFAISYHSYGDEVLYPYICGTLAESAIYFDIRDKLASHLDYGMRPASSSGEDFEHFYNRYGTIAFLLEIGSDFQPAVSEYRLSIQPAVLKTLPFMLGLYSRPHFHFVVKDAQTGLPVIANVAIEQVSFKEGEKRATDSFGVHRWWLVPGGYKVTVSAPGYKAQTVSATLSKADQLVEFSLAK